MILKKYILNYLLNKMMDKIEVILFQYYILIIRFILNILKNNLVYVNSFNKIKNIFSKIIQYFQRSYEYLTKYFHLNR